MSIFDLRIETERLILRPLLREDYEPYLAFCADEATMRTLGGVQPPSVAWRGFCSLAGAWQLFGFSMFSVIEKSSGDWIGRMGPWQPQDWPGTEVGWGIRHASWGRGYAPEAAVAAIDWAFDTLGWAEVIIPSPRTTTTRGPWHASWEAPCCAWGSCQRHTTTSPCRSGASRANSGLSLIHI